MYRHEYILDIAEEILSTTLNKGVNEAVIRIQEKIREDIIFDNGILRTCSFTKISGIGLTVYVNGSIGYSYTTQFNKDNITKMIDNAITLAKALEHKVDKYWLKEINVKGVRDRYSTIYRVNPLDIDLETKTMLINRLNKDSIKKQEIVSAITGYGFEKDTKTIISSFGSFITMEVYIIGISHTAIARYGNVIERVRDSKSFIGGYEHINEFDWQQFINDIDSLAIRVVEAPTIAPGTYPVVIDNELIGLLLHEAFGHASEGDLVYAELSVLKNKLGTAIGNESVSIIDEGITIGGYPVPYDDDGIKKEHTYIVRDGILVGYLHSIVTAKKLKHNVTGNARAQDIFFNPIVRQTNLYMLPGNVKYDELFENMDYGIYLRGKGASGGQVNPAIGTFTFSAGPSYMIKKGEVSNLVRGVIVSGNILEVLRNTELIGRDLNITTSVFGGCGKDSQMVHVGYGGPHIRVKRLTIGVT